MFRVVERGGEKLILGVFADVQPHLIPDVRPKMSQAPDGDKEKQGGAEGEEDAGEPAQEAVMPGKAPYQGIDGPQNGQQGQNLPEGEGKRRGGGGQDRDHAPGEIGVKGKNQRGGAGRRQDEDAGQGEKNSGENDT